MKKNPSRHKPDCRRDPADLPDSLPPATSAESLFLGPEIEVLDQFVTGVQREDAVIQRLRLEGSILERVALPRAIIRVAKWKDVRLTECDWANAELASSTGLRVEWVGCRMTGLRLGQTEWKSLLISGGDQRYSQFRFSKFENCEFVDCDFQDADFYGADLRGCVFRRCRLQNAEMSKTKLEGTDLRGSIVDGIRLEANDLKGAIVDIEQALVFAPLLGIEIR